MGWGLPIIIGLGWIWIKSKLVKWVNEFYIPNPIISTPNPPIWHPYFYLFISSPLLTLISLFLYPFIFLLLWLFLSLSSYYKFANLFHSIHILSHKKVITLSLSCVFFFFWVFFLNSFCIFTLYWWISLFFRTLLLFSLSLSLSYIYIFLFCLDFYLFIYFISLLLVDEFVCSLKLYFRLMHTRIKN